MIFHNIFMNNLNNLNFINSFPLVNVRKHNQVFHKASPFHKFVLFLKQTQALETLPGSFGNWSHLPPGDPTTQFSSLPGKASGETPDSTALQIRMCLHISVLSRNISSLFQLFPQHSHSIIYLTVLLLFLRAYSRLSKHFSFPSWLSLEKLNPRTSLISPKGSAGKSCHLRSMYRNFPNEEESILIFPTFGIFQVGRHLRPRLPHHQTKVAGPCKGMLWEKPMISAGAPRIMITKCTYN